MSLHAAFRAPILGLMAALLALVSACSEAPVDWPLDPQGGGTTCAYCNNVMGDRFHAARVRFIDERGNSELRYFDDFGCAVLWLKDHPEADRPDTHLWVTDWRSGAWIDARTAVYLKGQVSPQRHGIGAQWDPDPRGMTFEQARASVLDAQARTGTHPAHRAAPAGPAQGAAGRPF
jgi:hypothetical protein